MTIDRIGSTDARERNNRHAANGATMSGRLQELFREDAHSFAAIAPRRDGLRTGVWVADLRDDSGV